MADAQPLAPVEALAPAPVLTATVGDNDVTFRNIVRLYLRPKDLVVDLTFGYGRFWRKVEERHMPRLVRMDLDHLHPHKRMDVVADYRRPLPFREGSVGAFVFDPPYKTGSAADMTEGHDGYGNNGRPERGVAEVWELYRHVLEEGIYPALQPRGLAIVKGMDGVESGRNHWFMHSPALLPTGGWHERWELVDLFVVVRKAKPGMRHSVQFHARKNHSYFVVLRKRPLRNQTRGTPFM